MAAGPRAVGVHSFGCRVSPWVRSSGGQLLESNWWLAGAQLEGLVPSTGMAVRFNWGYQAGLWHSATKPWAGCWCRCRSQAPVVEGREERGCGWCLQTQNTCGATTEDIRRRSAAAALALGFFSDESRWGPLQSGSHGCSHC